MSSSPGFLWGAEEFTALELIETFKDSFPIVVRVKDGYCGDSPWECLSQSEVLRIHGVDQQTRVIAKDRHGRYYSIPAAYPACPTQPGKQSTGFARLSELLQSFTVPFEVELDTEGVRRADADEPYGHINIQRIAIIDKYEERHLKANLIQTSGINQDVILIPAYVRATFEVSHPTELDTAIHRKATKTIDFSKTKTNHSILIYSSHMLEKKIESRKKYGDESVYESLTPDSMISSDQSNLTYQSLQGPKVDQNSQRPRGDSEREENQYQAIVEEMKRTNLHSTGTRERAKVDETREMSYGKPVLPVKPSHNAPPLSSHHVGGQGSLQHTRGRDVQHRPPAEEPIQVDSEFPSDVSDATMEELCRCLKLLHMERHCELFRLHLVDGQLLMRLTKHVLVEELGMSSLDAEKLVMFCRGWRPK